MSVAILSFYAFVRINDIESLQQRILFLCKKKLVKGTILLAHEGFNATISGDEISVNEVLTKIIDMTDACEVMSKVNYDDTAPFSKMKVKIKPEIIKMGVGDLDISNLKGDYIDPADWDEFISREDVILIDTRNKYEIEVGTFEGAINPQTNTFTEIPRWVSENEDLLTGKKIAMCCTGGVRCEKSTAYLKQIGYNEVYHLRGGILQYLEDTGNKNHKWQGDCFVFDDRVAVNDNLDALMIERPIRGYNNRAVVSGL
jgi:UPF0176 protein